MKSPSTTSVGKGTPWLLMAGGFLAGFLLVHGWQSGASHARLSGQSPGTRQDSPASSRPPGREKNRIAETGSALPTPDSLNAADELVFQSVEIEKQLKGPLGRLEKFLQQSEMKTLKTQQIGEPDGDSIVRIEVTALSSADREKFWTLAEQELLKLEPGLQPYFMARVQNIQALFLSHSQETGVLFVKQLGTKVPGEPSVQYWFFQTNAPDGYVLGQDGSIAMPGNEPLPQATPWFAPGSYKQPPRLKHLVSFKYN